MIPDSLQDRIKQIHSTLFGYLHRFAVYTAVPVLTLISIYISFGVIVQSALLVYDSLLIGLLGPIKGITRIEGSLYLLLPTSVFALISYYSPRPWIPVLRDVMIRFYPIFMPWLLQLLLVYSALVVYATNVSGGSTVSADNSLIVLLLATFTSTAIFVVQFIRSLPWIRAYIKVIANWTKNRLLPPDGRDTWHIENPITQQDATELNRYTAVSPSEMVRRNLKPASVRAVGFYLLAGVATFLSIYIAIRSSISFNPQRELSDAEVLRIAVYSTPELISRFVEQPPFTGQEGQFSEFISAGLGSLGIPGVVISVLITSLGLGGLNLIIAVGVLAFPTAFLVISCWNFVYIYEEAEYRFLRGIEQFDTVNNPSKDLIALSLFHVVVMFHATSVLLASFALSPVLFTFYFIWLVGSWIGVYLMRKRVIGLLSKRAEEGSMILIFSGMIPYFILLPLVYISYSP